MFNHIRNLLSAYRQTREQGFTLLEYCAGAAVILLIVWGALQALGTNLSGLLAEIGDWADRQGEAISNQ